jgi:biopolymer transport protein ExbB/TolQ
MVEFFADSLVNGFMQSSMMGKGIVLVQLAASVVMVAVIIGKVKELAQVGRLTRRVSRDVMTGRDVMEYYLARHPSAHSPIENIYHETCDRLFKLLDAVDDVIDLFFHLKHLLDIFSFVLILF